MSWRLRWCAQAIRAFSSAVTGVRACWTEGIPDGQARVYYANHASHGDFVLVWAAMPASLRAIVRPVAAADYWLTSPLKRFIGVGVFRALLIHRQPAGTRLAEPCGDEAAGAADDPIGLMREALVRGEALIVFPEGTRNTGDDTLLAFKSGIYRLAQQRPDTEFVPVWINNLNRVLPKGRMLPIPLLCTVTFGAPLRCLPGETKTSFLDRSRQALLALAPKD